MHGLETIAHTHDKAVGLPVVLGVNHVVTVDLGSETPMASRGNNELLKDLLVTPGFLVVSLCIQGRLSCHSDGCSVSHAWVQLCQRQGDAISLQQQQGMLR